MSDDTQWDVGVGDPPEREFFEHLVVAVEALRRLGRASTQKDRFAIRQSHELPRSVFSYLARRGLLERGDTRDKRVLSRNLLDIPAGEVVDVLADILGPLPSGRSHSEAWKRAVHGAMREWALQAGVAGAMPEPDFIALPKGAWTDLLWAPLRRHAPGWIARKDRHRWLHHLRSSQGFALNVFGPLHPDLAESWAARVWSPFLGGTVRGVTFEYPTSGDPLSEVRPDRPSRTRADVRLELEGESILVEVKLTEPEFGACSAGHDPDNPHRVHSCEVPFRSVPALRAHCYLERALGRRYFELLERGDSLVDGARLAVHGQGGCPLRNDLYQLVRNLLLVQDLRAREGRPARFAVLAPSAELNPPLHRAAGTSRNLEDSLRSILKDSERASVMVIDARDVVERAQASDAPEAQDWARFMTARYLEPLEAGRRASKSPRG